MSTSLSLSETILRQSEVSLSERTISLREREVSSAQKRTISLRQRERDKELALSKKKSPLSYRLFLSARVLSIKICNIEAATQTSGEKREARGFKRNMGRTGMSSTTGASCCGGKSTLRGDSPLRGASPGETPLRQEFRPRPPSARADRTYIMGGVNMRTLGEKDTVIGGGIRITRM